MKRLFLLATVLICSFQYSASQAIDTIFGRCPGYYYYGWYDECPRYEADSNDFALFGFSSQTALLERGECSQVLCEEQYAPRPLTIKGVAVMVAIDAGEDYVAGLYMPSSDSLKNAEFVYVYQGGAVLPGMPESFYPRRMTLLDSVRWDTAAPKRMMLPLSRRADSVGDTSRMLSCYVYEAWFPSEVMVTDTFYFSGTYRSNVFDTNDHYLHYPTVYVMMRDFYEDRCEMCPVKERVFMSYQSWQEEWMRVYNWNWLVSGPFIPIVGRRD